MHHELIVLWHAKKMQAKKNAGGEAVGMTVTSVVAFCTRCQRKGILHVYSKVKTENVMKDCTYRCLPWSIKEMVVGRKSSLGNNYGFGSKVLISFWHHFSQMSTNYRGRWVSSQETVYRAPFDHHHPVFWWSSSYYPSHHHFGLSLHMHLCREFINLGDRM